MKLDEYDLKVFDKAEELMFTDYGIKKYPDYNEGYISHDNLISLVEELLSKIDKLQEDYEDLEESIKENYKPITKQEQYEG
jgi:hemerythrin